MVIVECCGYDWIIPESQRVVNYGGSRAQRSRTKTLIFEPSELHCLSGAGRFSRRVENLHDDDVGVEGVEIAVIRDAAGEDGGEVVERVAVILREGGGDS